MNIERKCELVVLECQLNRESERFETMDKYLTPIEEIEEVTNRYYDLFDQVSSLKNAKE